MPIAIAFILLTYVLSALLVGAQILGGIVLKSPAGMAIAVAYMFMPALATVVLQRVHGRSVKELGIRGPWTRGFTLGWLLPPVLALAAFGVALLMPGVTFTPGMEGMFERFGGSLTPEQVDQMRRSIEAMPVHPIVLALLQGLIAGVTINAVAAFGEELGWRGLLWTEWRSWGFWRASAAIGAVWGLWHAPLILQGHNYPQHPAAGVGMMIVFCILLSPLFSYVRQRTGSVLAAAVMHGSLNGTFGLSIMLIQGGNDLTVGLTGLAGLIAIAAFDLMLWLAARRGLVRLDADHATDQSENASDNEIAG